MELLNWKYILDNKRECGHVPTLYFYLYNNKSQLNRRGHAPLLLSFK